MRVFASSKWIALAAAVLAVGLSGRALAQRNDPNSRNDSRSESRDSADRSKEGQKEGHIDKMVADQLLAMSAGEVQLANFALQRTQNEAVRQFAQMMIQDHNKLNTELEKFASPELARKLNDASRQTGQPGQPGQPAQPGATATSQPGQPGQPGNPIGQPGTPGARPEQTAGQPGDRNTADLSTSASGDHVELCEDIGKQIGSLVTRELGQYQGSDFDRAYAGQQFWGHVTFIGVAKGAENHVSADLKQVLNQGASTAEQHLEHCRRLIRDLSTNVARGATETTPRR